MKGLLFTYLLTYCGSVVALFNPFVGLLIYVCFAIVRPDFMWRFSVPFGNYSRTVAIALLIGWAARGFGNWRVGRAALPMYCLIGFLVWAAISGMFADDPNTVWGFLDSKSKIVVPVVVGLTTITTIQQIKQLAWTIVLSMGYLAYEMNLSYFAGFNQLELYGFAGMDNNSAAIALVTVVGMSFFLGLSARNLVLRIIAFGCSALSAHAVLFSFSRGAMVALVATGITTFFLLPKRSLYIALYALGAAIGVSMAGKEVLKEFDTSFGDASTLDYSATSRFDLWGICLRMTMESPIFGIGPDHFPLHVHEYYVGSSGVSYFPKGKEAHTLWLQIMAETGIPGAMMLLGFYGLGFWEIWKAPFSRWKDEDDFVALLPSMIGAALVGFFVSSQFVSLEGLEIPYYVMMTGLGALIAVGKNTVRDSTPAHSQTHLENIAK